MAQTCCGFKARLTPTIRPACHGRRSLAAGSNSECPIAFSSSGHHWPFAAAPTNDRFGEMVVGRVNGGSGRRADWPNLAEERTRFAGLGQGIDGRVVAQLA